MLSVKQRISFFESLVWLYLGLNSDLPVQWQTLYLLGQLISQLCSAYLLNTCVNILTFKAFILQLSMWYLIILLLLCVNSANILTFEMLIMQPSMKYLPVQNYCEDLYSVLYINTLIPYLLNRLRHAINQQGLICHKINQPTNPVIDISVHL